MKLNSFEELFVILLSEMHFCETQIISALPKLVNKAYSEELKEAFQSHLVETREQLKRLDQIFRLLKETPRAVEWQDTTRMTVHGTDSFIRENTTSPLTDAALIVLAQRIEHFEIANYGTLIEFANVMDLEEIAKILKETLKEEEHADAKLTKLAKGGLFSSGINVEATYRKK